MAFHYYCLWRVLNLITLLHIWDQFMLFEVKYVLLFIFLSMRRRVKNYIILITGYYLFILFFNVIIADCSFWSHKKKEKEEACNSRSSWRGVCWYSSWENRELVWYIPFPVVEVIMTLVSFWNHFLGWQYVWSYLYYFVMQFLMVLKLHLLVWKRRRKNQLVTVLSSLFLLTWWFVCDFVLN